VRWFFLDGGCILLAVVLLGAVAYRLAGTVRRANAAVTDLQDRLSRLAADTTAVATRLDRGTLGDRAST
jgi:hypothetical protein